MSPEDWEVHRQAAGGSILTVLPVLGLALGAGTRRRDRCLPGRSGLGCSTVGGPAAVGAALEQKKSKQNLSTPSWCIRIHQEQGCSRDTHLGVYKTLFLYTPRCGFLLKTPILVYTISYTPRWTYTPRLGIHVLDFCYRKGLA